ncbi:hypothetical protein CIB48_g576 [Xylaria polymorpha]|nr:hypothetical protein CIB48_g576 [Xylaria polymorpha]
MSSRSPYGGLANLAKFKGFKSAVDEDVSDETMRAQLRFDRSLNQPRPMKLSSADIQLIDEKLYANAESDPISLFDLLNEDRVPSLDARLTLVRALTEAILEKLHAVDWLESPPAIAAEDLYRHPSVQGGLRDNSGHGFG